MADLVVTVLIHTGLNLVAIVILLSPLWLAKARCELYGIVVVTPTVRSSFDIQQALKKECSD